MSLTSPTLPAVDTDMGAAYDRVEEQLALLLPEITEIRRYLHQHPELSNAEFATTRYLSQRLHKEGIAHRFGPDGRGIFTDIARPQHSSQPAMALRADMDALPINEETNFDFRSQVTNVMHACGHDAHTAMLMGATLALHRAGSLPVAWRSIFQPAEEAGHGALDMVEHGALEDIQAIVALHVDGGLNAGKVGISPGPQTSCCQDFQIEVKGRGGHAARPFLTVDPLAIAANLVTSIYQAVPRQTDARLPVVVTIGQFTSGHCTNVIPDTALLRGTVRSINLTVGKQTKETMERLCAGVAQGFGAEIIPTFDRPLGGVSNDEHVTSTWTQSAQELLGRDMVETQPSYSMGAEDFADYLPVVPGCMMRLGVRTADKPITPLHTSTFQIDESALILGSRMFIRALFAWSKSLN